MLIRTIVIIIILLSSVTLIISDINLINHKFILKKESVALNANKLNINKNDTLNKTLSQEEIKSYFYKVAGVPYVEDKGPTKTPEQFWHLNHGDCDDKSFALLIIFKKMELKILR